MWRRKSKAKAKAKAEAKAKAQEQARANAKNSNADGGSGIEVDTSSVLTNNSAPTSPSNFDSNSSLSAVDKVFVGHVRVVTAKRPLSQLLASVFSVPNSFAGYQLGYTCAHNLRWSASISIDASQAQANTLNGGASSGGGGGGSGNDRKETSAHATVANSIPTYANANFQNSNANALNDAESVGVGVGSLANANGSSSSFDQSPVDKRAAIFEGELLKVGANLKVRTQRRAQVFPGLLVYSGAWNAAASNIPLDKAQVGWSVSTCVRSFLLFIFLFFIFFFFFFVVE